MNHIVKYKSLEPDLLESRPKIEIYGKITFSQAREFTNGGGLITYSLLNNKETYKIKIFYNGLKPDIIPNETLIRVSGILKKNVYKNDSGEWIDLGYEIITDNYVINYEEA